MFNIVQENVKKCLQIFKKCFKKYLKFFFKYFKLIFKIFLKNVKKIFQKKCAEDFT